MDPDDIFWRAALSLANGLGTVRRADIEYDRHGVDMTVTLTVSIRELEQVIGHRSRLANAVAEANRLPRIPPTSASQPSPVPTTRELFQTELEHASRRTARPQMPLNPDRTGLDADIVRVIEHVEQHGTARTPSEPTAEERPPSPQEPEDDATTRFRMLELD